MPKPKDSVALICDIGELAGLFEKSTSLENFLQTAVGIVAYHMRAAVCSVYLYDDATTELTLTATQGLSAESIGKVKLRLGEGLVGVSLKELRPIREGVASRHPLFKFIPGIQEEKYQAFLAVPILRGITRVGVLVVQDPVESYFDENDARALQAIAAQLATVIENAKLLMSLHLREEARSMEAGLSAPEMRFVRGTAASGGLARGRALVLDASAGPLSDMQAPARASTLADFHRAVALTEQQLEALQRRTDEMLADVASLIFSSHLLIVKDSKFSGAMAELIERGQEPRAAIIKVVTDYIELFSRSKNPRLREKTQDVKDVGRRLIRNLTTDTEHEADYVGRVIVAAELLPSDIVKMGAQRAEGLLLVSGGATSHVAILARSMQLPMVIVDEKRLLTLKNKEMVLVDGEQGNVYVDPAADVVKQYDALAASRREAEAHTHTVQPSTHTRDGRRIHLLANINMLSELALAEKLKAEGVGLYRSEFPFIVRSDFPSEEEQYRIYSKILEETGGKPVVFRTLDIGGDKMLSYFPTVNEANPFLGLRAIRFSLRYKDIFQRQLRALLRAGHRKPIRIMFPLVSSVDDFLEAREVVRQCLGGLQNDGIPHQSKPLLGVMIELPSAVEVADELAQEADFLSVGSNDLVQYVLAVDRTNEHISDLYVPYHPAVLRSLKRVADAARKHRKPLSICGEMAADRRLLPFLIGIGIDTLSMEAKQIPQTQKAISAISFAESQHLARALLKMGRIREIAQHLEVSPGQ